MKYLNYHWLCGKFRQLAAIKMCQVCKNFIEEGSKILDLGCGSGIISNEFQKYFKTDLIGVDISDQRIEKIPFQIIEEKNLPFSENSFNVVLIFWVLHHTLDPIILLREARRVTKERIIIFEDLPEGFLSRLICKIHGVFFKEFIQGKCHKGNFKKGKEWKEIFKNLNLKLVFEKKISSIWIRKMFVLEKNN